MSWQRPSDDEVLAGWAPAGRGRIVVVLGQGVVIHKAVISGRAAAAGIARGVGAGAGAAVGAAGGGLVGAASTAQIDGSPFLAKVLRDGVPGLLASPRMTVVRWEQIVSARCHWLRFGRGR